MRLPVHSRTLCVPGFLSLLAAVLSVQPANAVVYTTKPLQDHLLYVEPYGISNDGIIVGREYIYGAYYPFILEDGRYSNVDAPYTPAGYRPDSTTFVAYDRSQLALVQVDYDSPPKHYGYLWQNYSYDPPEPDQTFLQGLNDNGKIVGYTFDTTNGNSHGFIGTTLSPTATPYDYPGGEAANGTRLFGINNNDRFVGWGWDQYFHAMGFYQDESLVFTQTVHPIDPPSSVTLDVFPQAINDNSLIVGYYRNHSTSGDQPTHGFVFDPPNYYVTIDPPGSTSTYIRGINNDGTMVGTFVDANNHVEGFMAFPATYATADVIAALQLAGGLNASSGVTGPSGLPLDVDYDGRVTISDAATIIRKVTGLLTNP